MSASSTPATEREDGPTPVPSPDLQETATAENTAGDAPAENDSLTTRNNKVRRCNVTVKTSERWTIQFPKVGEGKLPKAEEGELVEKKKFPEIEKGKAFDVAYTMDIEHTHIQPKCVKKGVHRPKLVKVDVYIQRVDDMDCCYLEDSGIDHKVGTLENVVFNPTPGQYGFEISGKVVYNGEHTGKAQIFFIPFYGRYTNDGKATKWKHIYGKYDSSSSNKKKTSLNRKKTSLNRKKIFLNRKKTSSSSKKKETYYVMIT